MPYLHVAIASPLKTLFTYFQPDDQECQAQPGFRVLVPFRNKTRVGIVIQTSAVPPSDIDPKKIKPITQVLDRTPVFSLQFLKLLCWLSDYYFAPMGLVCQAALPNRLMDPEIVSAPKPRVEEDQNSFQETAPIQLTAAQESSVREILSAVSPVLLHGITGSGKTEIYLKAMEEVLAQGKQVLFLVPEIALTPQLIGRVAGRLKKEIAVYHSGLTESQRHRYWNKMQRGDIAVVVGTRSALFAPFPKLGLIVVDEEQDSSYKQQEGFYYHARDAAIVRAKLEGALVVLGSATPALESFFNARQGKYHYIRLEERATGALLPQVALIDLRNTPLMADCQTLSLPLKEALEENLARREQSLLLLNRRGFANFLICRECGHTWNCLNCDITLTLHARPARLLCHYCDLTQDVPTECPDCKGIQIKPLGAGTEKLEEDLIRIFPQAVIARLDADTAMSRHHRNKVLQQMHGGQIDILIGTQMIAKGHDFPNVTLVGVVLADAALHMPDFRAAERTFQLLTQVAGRSGRADKPGHVLIQTYHPEHFSFQHALTHDHAQFAESELQHREALLYPPFSRLAQIRFQGPKAEEVEAAAHRMKNYLMQTESSIQLLGPAPAPLTKVRGQYRWLLLMKSPNSKTLQWLLKNAEKQGQKLSAGIQTIVDIDPLQML